MENQQFEQTSLDTNPFFIYLKTKQPKLYEMISQNLYKICVPCQRSLVGVKLTKEFVLLHILTKSPYYKGECVTIQDQEKAVIVDRLFLNLHRGWKQKRLIKVLSTEMFYNREYQSYEVVIIESDFSEKKTKKSTNKNSKIKNMKLSPLHSPRTQKNLTKKQKKIDELMKKRRSEIIVCLPKSMTYVEILKFWKKIGKKKIRLKSFKFFSQDLQIFKESYFLVKKYEKEIGKKVSTLYSQSADLLIKQDLVLSSFPSNSYNGQKLINSLKILIVGKLKIWEKIRRFYQTEDSVCNEQILLLQKITPQIAGIIEPLRIDYSLAIQELQSIANCKTAFEKLIIIDKTIMTINELVENSNSKINSLSTDDLIPIFSYIIVKSKIPNLFSTTVYLQHFNLCDMITSKYAFEITLIDSIVNNLIYEKKLLKMFNDFKQLEKTNKQSSILKQNKLNHINDQNINMDNNDSNHMGEQNLKNLIPTESNLRQQNNLLIKEIL
ncbi:ankyrin repeat domain-containing protein [Anaeramoeba flamelloides]|uniref:Ankyrin repeat domain-containing protein n=1 Tax=Anaeramoeba flamelloides TaxID=1746091 RepID=A0AAV8AJY7_9EUKA|nr:ankyrin repeat domain-containing protein [Anaeramoeba flamelloides]